MTVLTMFKMLTKQNRSLQYNQWYQDKQNIHDLHRIGTKDGILHKIDYKYINFHFLDRNKKETHQQFMFNLKNLLQTFILQYTENLIIKLNFVITTQLCNCLFQKNDLQTIRKILITKNNLKQELLGKDLWGGTNIRNIMETIAVHRVAKFRVWTIPKCFSIF